MNKDTKTKVYQEVLEKIREYIVKHHLQDGDRLPSERELAEQLDAGRSSIREALRAIELLGLIETRHGEGTFLRSYQPYYSVEILSTFILQETRSQNEVLQVKFFLEKEVLSTLSGKLTDEMDQRIRQQISEIPNEQLHTYVFSELIAFVENRLLKKIWHLLDGFSRPVLTREQDPAFYEQLLDLLKANRLDEAKEKLNRLYVLE